MLTDPNHIQADDAENVNSPGKRRLKNTCKFVKCLEKLVFHKKTRKNLVLFLNS